MRTAVAIAVVITASIGIGAVATSQCDSRSAQLSVRVRPPSTDLRSSTPTRELRPIVPGRPRAAPTSLPDHAPNARLGKPAALEFDVVPGSGLSRERLDQLTEYIDEKSAAWDAAYETALRDVATEAEVEILLDLYRKGEAQALTVSEDAEDDHTNARIYEVVDAQKTAAREILGEVRYGAFIERQFAILKENGGLDIRPAD